MADALDSKSSEGKPRAGSSPASGIAARPCSRCRNRSHQFARNLADSGDQSGIYRAIKSLNPMEIAKLKEDWETNNQGASFEDHIKKILDVRGP